jgi:hypothetical protein
MKLVEGRLRQLSLHIRAHQRAISAYLARAAAPQVGPAARTMQDKM